MLEAAPELRAIAVFDEVCRRHPEINPGIRRTLERRIRTWRALNGSDRQVIFRQTHEPGGLGLSDFTHMAASGVTIAGDAVAVPEVNVELVALSVYDELATVLTVHHEVAA